MDRVIIFKTESVPEDIDIECIPLCIAMNEMPGIRTTESCCGHGNHPFRMWFEAESLEYLPRLLYWFAVCHCGFGGWSIKVTTDCGMSPVTFLIEGGVGEAAYEESLQIAELLLAHRTEEGDKE